jgi:hypothetical protein
MGFEPGNRANPAGKPKGVKNRLNWAFVTALMEDFEAHGIEAIRICRIEDPTAYVKICAGLLPKEFSIEDNRLTELGDDELDAIINYARHRLTAKRELVSDARSRENETTYRVETSVLHAIPKAS